MKPKRIYYFDNIKALLIFLVVFGHLCESFISSSSYMYICTIIYTFHMPLFVFCSGYFAKPLTKQSAKTTLYPYIIFQAAYLFFINALPGGYEAFSFTSPAYITWYLLSFFFWQAILTAIKSATLKSIFFAIAISLVVGFDINIGNGLSMSRTIVFLPYFLFGSYIKNTDFHFFKLKKNRWIKVIVAVLSVALLVLMWLKRDFLDYSCFWGAYGYVYNNNVYLRLVSYAIATIFSLAIVLLIPQKKISFISSIGSRTLSVYLLHGFVVIIVKRLFPFSYFTSNAALIICLLVLALLITTALSSKPIVYIFNVIFVESSEVKSLKEPQNPDQAT